MMTLTRLGLRALCLLIGTGMALPALAASPVLYTDWSSIHVADGLPAEKVFCVTVDDERVWVGTDQGLGVLEDGEWTTYTTADGLAYDAVLSVAIDTMSGDVWAGTMGGLTRVSGGRLTSYTQFDSGLPNDVVFGVAVENQNVWTATTTGEGRYMVREDRWQVFTPENAPQHEPWGYHVDYDNGKVWAALWGGGVLEFDVATERWQSYMDPDGEMEIDLFRDDGLIHSITTAVSFRSGILWASTYFGLSSYDGRRWRGYMDHDSGLASNFVNFVKAKGRVAWVCTDKGLSVVDYDNNQWITYAPAGDVQDTAGPWVARRYDDGQLLDQINLPQGLANNYVLGVDFRGDEVWVATAQGLSVGRPGAGARVGSTENAPTSERTGGGE